MMPLSALLAVWDGLDDAGCSPVAEGAARLWGLPAGTARFWRSSACHVFAVVRNEEAVGYLRMRPCPGSPEAPALAESADLAAELSSAGLPVVAPLLSVAGRTAETVATALGPMEAMCVEAAPGRHLDEETLTPAEASSWGALLARLHAHVPDRPLPDVPCRRAAAATRGRPEDPELDAAVAAVGHRLRALPSAATRVGLVHGDLELDNLRWDEGRPRCFDLDEAGRGPLLLDLVTASRDVEDRPDLLAAFLAGYGYTGPSEWLDTFRLLRSAVGLSGLDGVLDVPERSDEPAWAQRLREVVPQRRTRERAVLLARG